MMPKVNNFDLIRLVAALQVALTHSMLDFGRARDSRLQLAADLIPGVPIFFFISGFLISKSFENNPRIREFALNRFLRIYPGLVVCFLVALASVWLTGYFATVTVSLPSLLAWIAAQLSFAQFYNPDFMRQYGVGVLNGSTWTLCVELQFYALVPLLYMKLRLQNATVGRTNALLAVLIAVFIVVNRIYIHAETVDAARPLWFKLLGVSFAPWFYMFLVGVLFQKNFDVLQRLFGGRFVPVVVSYVLLAFIAERYLHWGFNNSVNPALFLALCVVTFSAAFSAANLSDRLLRRNDLSYGVYIYHGPVINLLIALGLATATGSVLIAVAISLLLAFASWRFVEKPALALKRHPLYQHPSSGLPR